MKRGAPHEPRWWTGTPPYAAGVVGWRANRYRGLDVGRERFHGRPPESGTLVKSAPGADPLQPLNLRNRRRRVSRPHPIPWFHAPLRYR